MSRRSGPNELRTSLEPTALEGGRGHLGKDVQYGEIGCLLLDPVPLRNSFLRRLSASLVWASLCTMGSPDLCHKTSQTGPYLEKPREKEASRSPRTRSSGHKHCLRSCQGTWRLCRESRLAEGRGTNGVGAPSSPHLHSQGHLWRGVRGNVNLSLAELKWFHCGGPQRPPLSTQTQSGALPDSRADYEQ